MESFDKLRKGYAEDSGINRSKNIGRNFIMLLLTLKYLKVVITLYCNEFLRGLYHYLRMNETYLTYKA